MKSSKLKLVSAICFTIASAGFFVLALRGHEISIFAATLNAIAAFMWWNLWLSADGA